MMNYNCLKEEISTASQWLAIEYLACGSLKHERHGSDRGVFIQHRLAVTTCNKSGSLIHVRVEI